MTTVLAIDTSGTACSVALRKEGQTVSRHHEVSPKKQAQLALPFIDAVLSDATLSLNDIDALAFGAGPGSFTGIRLAASVVQALGYAAKKPVVPISSLRAMAEEANRKQGAQNICVLQNAFMQEVYVGFYQHDGKFMKAVQDDFLAKPNSFTIPFDEYLSVGDMSETKEITFPDAAIIAELAEIEYDAGNTVNAVDALPVYLRGKEAWQTM